VIRGVEVLGGVFVLRRIATADVPADQAQSQVDPRVAHFEAFFATPLVCVLDLDLIEMPAGFGHVSVQNEAILTQGHRTASAGFRSKC
jgi:hypothetical protein